MILLKLRYRSLLDQILTNTGTDLTDTLKLFIEASKYSFCARSKQIN